MGVHWISRQVIPFVLCRESKIGFQAHWLFSKFSFPSMATGGPLMAMSESGAGHPCTTGGPWMAMSKSGAGHPWTTGGPPMVHRREFPGPPMTTGEIPRSLSGVNFEFLDVLVFKIIAE